VRLGQSSPTNKNVFNLNLESVSKAIGWLLGGQHKNKVRSTIESKTDFSLKNFCPSVCVGMELALARTILARRILVESENIYTQLT
jgi:hypothetical protein